MAMTEQQPSANAPSADTRGFRPGSRRRARIAGGVALAAVAVGGNVLVYSSLGDTTEVVQVVHDVRAGELVTMADLRVVEVDLNPTVPVVTGADISLVANTYARVHLASGTLIVSSLVQPDPLVTTGAAVVAIQISPDRMPFGLRERSRVRLVIESDTDETGRFEAVGRVVHRGDTSDGVSGNFALSIELSEADATVIAASNDVEIILLPQADDPVYAEVTD